MFHQIRLRSAREQEGCPSDRYDSHWEDRPSDQQLDYGPTEPLASDRYVSALDGEDAISRTSYDEGFKSDELDYERVVSQ